jgi:hypothetical protein
LVSLTAKPRKFRSDGGLAAGATRRKKRMKDSKRTAAAAAAAAPGASIPNRILGTLRDALQAASRESTGEVSGRPRALRQPPTSSQSAARADGAPVLATIPTAAQRPAPAGSAFGEPVSAAQALREAKSPAPEGHEAAAEPTTRVVHATAATLKPTPPLPVLDDVGRTQAVRGKPKVTRSTFHADPVVGWMVVVGGPGLGAFRPIYEGNNTLGRSKGQRIPIDFGDDSISAEEQAYVRYDSVDRSFLFVPNLAKTNIVSINNKKPTGAVPLQAMDVITVGRTQLAFVPFCGEEFDWSELTDLKE